MEVDQVSPEQKGSKLTLFTGSGARSPKTVALFILLNINGPSLFILRFEVPAFQLQIQPWLRWKWLSSIGYFCCPAGKPNAHLVTVAVDNSSLERRAEAGWRWENVVEAGGFSQQIEKTLRKEGTAVNRAGRGTLIHSSKKGYLEQDDSLPTEPGPCWQKATWGGGWGPMSRRPELALQWSSAWFQLYLSWLLTRKSEATPAPSGMSLWGRPGAGLFPFLPPTSHPPSPLPSPLLTRDWTLNVNKFTNMELNLLSSQTTKVTIAS